MGEVTVVEAPGAVGDVYQCPNCSRSYPSWDVEAGPPAIDKETGRQVSHINPPVTCKRCGSPMDINRALHFSKGEDGKADKSFGDVQAEMAAEGAANPALSRRTMKF